MDLHGSPFVYWAHPNLLIQIAVLHILILQPIVRGSPIYQTNALFVGNCNQSKLPGETTATITTTKRGIKGQVQYECNSGGNIGWPYINWITRNELSMHHSHLQISDLALVRWQCCCTLSPLNVLRARRGEKSGGCQWFRLKNRIGAEKRHARVLPIGFVMALGKCKTWVTDQKYGPGWTRVVQKKGAPKMNLIQRYSNRQTDFGRAWNCKEDRMQPTCWYETARFNACFLLKLRFTHVLETCVRCKYPKKPNDKNGVLSPTNGVWSQKNTVSCSHVLRKFPTTLNWAHRICTKSIQKRSNLALSNMVSIHLGPLRISSWKWLEMYKVASLKVASSHPLLSREIPSKMEKTNMFKI